MTVPRSSGSLAIFAAIRCGSSSATSCSASDLCPSRGVQKHTIHAPRSDRTSAMVHRHSSWGRRNKGEDRNWITQEAEFQVRKMIDRWLKKRSTQKLKPSLAARARTIRLPTEATLGEESHGMV